MADLTDARIRARHHIEMADLGCAWAALAERSLVPPSWALADRLRAAGVAGILVPSFAFGATEADVNAIFWTWAAGPPHQVRVFDPEHPLPQDDRSWR